MAEEEQEVIIQDDPQELHQIDAILNNIKASITSNQVAQGIKVASSCFPPNIKSPQVKQQIIDVWASLLLHCPATDQLLNELTLEQRCSVAIYAAKVMGLLGDKKQTENALGWYSKITAKDGVGVLNRVIVNRK